MVYLQPPCDKESTSDLVSIRLDRGKLAQDVPVALDAVDDVVCCDLSSGDVFVRRKSKSHCT